MAFLESDAFFLFELQEKKNKTGLDISVFEAHLAALFGIENKNYSIIPITCGAQIIQRVVKKMPKKIPFKNFKKPGDIMTYVDQRYYSGKSYVKIGFKTVPSKISSNLKLVYVCSV